MRHPEPPLDARTLVQIKLLVGLAAACAAAALFARFRRKETRP